MAVKVPSQNKKAFEDVMSALGGDNYSYYLFDVTKIEQKDSKKKVQVALKVLVPQVKRAQATKDIMGGLRKAGYEIEEKANEISLELRKFNFDFVKYIFDFEYISFNNLNLSGSSKFLINYDKNIDEMIFNLKLGGNFKYPTQDRLQLV